MNMAVPAIDYLTRPHIVGHDDRRMPTMADAPVFKSGITLAVIAAVCTALVAVT